jgi:hypothetical protein
VADDTPEATLALLRAWLDLDDKARADMTACARACFQARYRMSSAVDDLERVLLEVARSVPPVAATAPARLQRSGAG